MDIKDLRDQIDDIDEELITLFLKRMNLSLQIAEYKKKHNLPIYVPEREEEILQKVAAKSGSDLECFTRELYTVIFELSRNYQQMQNFMK